jgi:predicted small secreted protein
MYRRRFVMSWMKPSRPAAEAEGSSFDVLSLAALLLASTLALGACNTAEGVGDDVEEAGDEIGDAID